MNDMRKLIRTAIFVAAGLVGGYLWWQQETAPADLATVAPEPIVAAPSTSADSTPATHYPVVTGDEAVFLPALADSDNALIQTMVALVGSDNWRQMFVPERIVRRIVATVDNLPRHDAPVGLWPLRPVGGAFQSRVSETGLAIDPANSARYARYIDMVRALDVHEVVRIYHAYYPIFQQAYVELGYPQGYFNDRLIVAIDDLLAAPEPSQSPAIAQPKVRYQFADRELEDRSAGQRIMLRIGIDNAQVVKGKLRDFRRALVSL
jgi:hypothetical protein